MTDQPLNPEAPPSPPPQRRNRKRPRWPWVLLGTGLLVGGLVAYSPTLFGGLILNRIGEQAGISGGQISGPLWSPKISNADVKLPGISATAGQASVTATSVDPVSKTVKVNVAVKDASVSLNLKELMSGQGATTSGGGSGWKVIVSGVDIQNTRVNVDGQGANIPSMKLTVQPGQDGKLKVQGTSADGNLSAVVKVDETGAGNKITLDFDADARMARTYWKGITGGQISGRYVFGDGPIHGDLKLRGGTLQVPEARMVEVTGISGTAIHRGDNITYNLTGRGWDGPVTAKGGVDLKAKNWTVTADATPTVSGLARSLNTTGQGDLKLRVTAGGWSTIRVKAYAQSTGKLAGIPYKDLNAEYTFLNRNAEQGGKPIIQTNDIAFSAQTELAGTQKIEGQWAFGRTGKIHAVGAFGQKPLDVKANINANNDLSLSGQGLGGPLGGTFKLKGQQISAVLNPTFAAAGARIALSGTPTNLRAVVSGGKAGPFDLNGTVHYSKSGLSADFGTVKLNLDKNFEGNWQARALKGAGVTLSGDGRINLTAGDVTGQASAVVPGLAEPLSGPLNLNYTRQQGTFKPGNQVITWNGGEFGIQARDLKVTGGALVNGNLTVTNTLRANGTLIVKGSGYNLIADAKGTVASLRGTAGDVTVLADTQLSAPFLTTARVQGADIRGVLSVDNGVRFSLTTAGDQASGVLNGENWNAQGRVNLAALRPLLPIKDLAGSLDLNLAGLGGNARLNASTGGAKVAGLLTRTPGSQTGGNLNADLTATLPVNGEAAVARIRGQVYPQVQAGGTVNYLGQTLNAALSGEYGNLKAQVTGRTAELSFGGVTLPSQAVNLRGNITPSLGISGTWGDLNATYDGQTGLFRVTGAQNLTAFGQQGRIQGRATWGPDFRGAVEARGILDQYSVAVSGPWSRLNVLLSDGEGLRGVGTASLPAGKYDVDLSGPLTVPGQGTLLVDGNIQGTGAEPRGVVNVTDRSGGKASITLRGFNDLDLNAQNLTLAGQKLQGQLNARGGILTGNLKAGPLNVVAAGGRIRATGDFAGQSIRASGKLTLPATISDLNVNVSGPYFSASATGEVANLRGSVRLHQQNYGADSARLVIPAQTFPLRASLTGARANVGGLIYQSGNWSGGLDLRYALEQLGSAQRGNIRLTGVGNKTLTALPSGPLSGRMQVLPAPSGTLSMSLAPFMGALPAELRQTIMPGRLVAQVRATGATLSTQQTLYQNRPLDLNAHLDWRSGLKVQGLLTHPGTRLPLVYDGQNLSISGARLDALALQPVLNGIQGNATLNLSVPGLNFAKASGRALVDFRAQNQQAKGAVSLSGGKLFANLSSNLAGKPVQVQGQLYPQANAIFTLDTILGTVTGDAARTLQVRAVSTYEGQNINVTALGSGLTGTTPTIKLLGLAAGADLNLALRRGTGAGLEGWKASGTASLSDLKKVAGVEGQVKVALSGTLADLRLLATGEAAGIQFAAPASFRGSVLRLNGATAKLEQGSVTLSGPVFPALNLSARANVTDGLPGTYTAQLSGPYSTPTLNVQGRLKSDGSAVWAQLKPRQNGVIGINVLAAGQRVSGTVRQAGGQWSSDLAGTLAGKAVQIRGDLYPQANAVLNVDGIRASLTGNATETLNLASRGVYQGHTFDLNAAATGLTKNAAQVKLRGLVDNAALDLGLAQGKGTGLTAWKTSGSMAVPDLNKLAGVDGQVSAVVSGSLEQVNVLATGTAANIPFTAPLRYQDGKVTVLDASAKLEQGQVFASGTVFPKLDVNARATLTDLLPGQYTAQIGGAYSKPDVRVQGQLAQAVQGLQVAGTRLTARLLGKDWKAELTGDAITGTARGQLGQNSAGGILNTQLRLNTAYQSGQTDVRLRGTTGWTAKAGWLGSLRATGDAPGGALDALLDGKGVLNLAGTLGTGDKQASFTGVLPAGLPLKPAGTLTLKNLDAGAFWGRAGQLRATGQASIGGAAWNKLEATFTGQILDSGGELTGDLSASYRAGNAEFRLNGERVKGSGTLRDGRYDATLKSETLRIARLLPATLDVDGLTFAGTAEAHGTLAGGPESLKLQNVALKAEQGQVGPFSLYGSAQYQPARSGVSGEVLKADLRGSLRGGLISASGELPTGLNVQVKDVPTSYKTASGEAASFGVGKVNAGLKLTGKVSDPYLSGTLNAVTDQLAANLTLSGRASDPQAHARIALKGQASGTLYADASQLDLNAGTVQAKVYGTVQSGGNRAQVNLNGTWPNLAGTVQAQLDGLSEPVTLSGDGTGNYALSAGKLGGGNLSLSGTKGFIPALAGRLNLTPLALLEGSSGQATVSATLGGTLAAPNLAANVTTLNASASGVTLLDTVGVISGSTAGLSGTLKQAGKDVASLQGNLLTLTNFGVKAAGSTIQASGSARLNGVADLALTSAGNVKGNLKASYQSQALTLKGNLSSQGLNADLDVKADQLTGWHGSAQVSGGPDGLLTQAAKLKLTGPLAHPLLTGDAGLLGAGARIVANANGVQVRLVDGPEATASGVIEVRPDDTGEWRWSGATSLSRPELSLSVTPTGPLADPQLTLSLRRGEWRASGTASKQNANLSLSDGQKDGTLIWNGTQASVNLPGLDLSHLQVGGLTGLVTANGSVNTGTQNGNIAFKVTNVTTPSEIPYLGVKIAGDISGNVNLQGGKPQIQAVADLNTGKLNLSATQFKTTDGLTRWGGNLQGTLKHDTGLLSLNLKADEKGLTGSANINSFTLKVMGRTPSLNGQVLFKGQTFSAVGKFGGTIQNAELSAEGGLADALPALENILAVKPTDDGYSAHALLNNLDVATLKLAPDLAGKVNGEININDGSGTFFLQTAALKVGPKTMPARLEGTQVGGDWRLRGYLDHSEFTAGLSSGEVFGRGTLQALPLGAIVGAISGTNPGEGVVTGIVRFRFPQADPTLGTATVVAERIRVSATRSENGVPVTETLTGTGTLDLANREVKNVNVQLSGAGTWDVKGQYTHNKVDINAVFSNTTFTPVLQLVPGLTELTPSLKGTLTLSAAGTYERPRGLLRAENLNGSVAGLSLQIPNFAGELPDSGAFSGGGKILTGGTVATDGNLNIQGQLTLGKLSNTRVKFTGLLAPEALGALPNTTATIRQNGENWILDAQSVSSNAASGAGSLILGGTLTPRIDLSLAAQNYNLPLSAIYAKESALTGTIRAVDDGQIINVSGSADFARLTLGRVNAPKTIPAPGESTASSTTSSNGTTTSFVSPLPEQYTTFPKPKTASDTTEEKPARPFLERIVLDDLQIRAPNGIRVDENLARAEFGTRGLTIAGTAARPRISGEITSQRGSIFLRENEFRIAQGDIQFNGEGLYPTFNIVANGIVPSSTTNQQVPVTLAVSGDFRTIDGQPNVLHLDTKLSCTTTSDACINKDTNQAYSEPELYALVATGVPNLATLPSNLQVLGTSALQTALNVFVLGEIERTLAKALGVDVFRLTPTLSTNGDVNATLTVGTYLTRELFLQYQVDLSGRGLIDATYSTPDGRFTFKVSTPLVGLDINSIRPDFSAAYNINRRTSLSIGVENNATTASTKYKFGVTYRIGAK